MIVDPLRVYQTLWRHIGYRCVKFSLWETLWGMRYDHFWFFMLALISLILEFMEIYASICGKIRVYEVYDGIWGYMRVYEVYEGIWGYTLLLSPMLSPSALFSPTLFPLPPPSVDVSYECF